MSAVVYEALLSLVMLSGGQGLRVIMSMDVLSPETPKDTKDIL